MAAQRRSATKQRRRGTVTAPASESVAAAAEAAPKPEPKAQAKTQQVASSKNAGSRQAASVQTGQVSKFRTTWERLRKGYQNTVSEIKKVTWPDSETTRNLTALVIAMSTVLGLLLGGIDFLLLKLFEVF